MGRLNALMNKTQNTNVKTEEPKKEIENGQTEVKAEQAQATPETRAESGKQESEGASQKEPEKPAASSRLAALGIKRDATPERKSREEVVDEDLKSFHDALTKLDAAIDEDALELRKGLVDVASRIKANEHIQEYLYENPEEMRIVVKGMRAQYLRRVQTTTERAKDAAKKKKELNALESAFNNL